MPAEEHRAGREQVSGVGRPAPEVENVAVVAVTEHGQGVAALREGSSKLEHLLEPRPVLGREVVSGAARDKASEEEEIENEEVVPEGLLPPATVGVGLGE